MPAKKVPRARDYFYDEESGALKINCLGKPYGASLEDYPETMARVIDALMEVNANSLVLIGSREYDYGPEQIGLLQEISRIITVVLRDKLISYNTLGTLACQRCYPEWIQKVQFIVAGLLRKDPVGAYIETLREINFAKTRMKSSFSKADYDCFSKYTTNILYPIKTMMEKTELIRKARPYMAGYKPGDRKIYKEIFAPTSRPNFMLTKFMITPPESRGLLDRYNIGDTRVEIYRVPETTQNLYFIIPPEFVLSKEKYAILDHARSNMAAHKPTTAEFVRSEKIREIFYNVGKDTIRETAERMHISLSTKDLEQIANILTRYTAGLGILEVLLADERIQDIYINSPVEREPVLIFHQDWEECKTNLIPTKEDAEIWATRLRIQSGRPLDEANPVLDTEMAVPGGNARFAVITKTLSPYGIGFAIRRHRDRPWTLPLFIKNKYLNPLAAGLLSFFIDGSVSMLIAGGRSSGKTSLLGAVMLEMLPKVRIITLEDTLELPVEQLRELKYNIERLKTRSVITRVETEMPADEALRTALRLGDSALIVGEIRSVEAKALYEAMRIGALSNVVAGTIHGESAYGIFDRVVNDLGVPKTSFKATDIIPIAKMLRSADGLHRFRRMTEIAEVRKEWDDNPLKEKGFVNLMEYSGKDDALKPTEALLNGESEVIKRISSYVKEWYNDWDAVWENINLRAKIKDTIVRYADQLKRPELLEAEWIVKANEHFHLIQEATRKETGAAEARRVYAEWLRWYRDVLAVKRSV